MLEESLVAVILAEKQEKKYYYKHTQILIGKVVNFWVKAFDFVKR